MRQFIYAVLFAVFGIPVQAVDLSAPFLSIDGGELRLDDWAGRPILVVNTASQCAFTRQYADLQALYDRYRDQGLVVVSVPSDDFNQELSTEAEVKAFCEVQFGLDHPMTSITKVRGAGAHPFYASLKAETGFVPRWNFNKVLIDPNGEVAATFGSRVAPMSSKITDRIDAFLN